MVVVALGREAKCLSGVVGVCGGGPRSGWRQSAIGKQRGGSGIDGQRQGGDILGKEAMTVLKRITVLIILRCAALLSTRSSNNKTKELSCLQ